MSGTSWFVPSPAVRPYLLMLAVPLDDGRMQLTEILHRGYDREQWRDAVMRAELNPVYRGRWLVLIDAEAPGRFQSLLVDFEPITYRRKRPRV